jgi:glutamate-5-semialdehyde dehydrogenase
MHKNRSEVLRYLADLLERHRNYIIDANQSDISTVKGEDPALIDRLKVDGKKINEMKMALLNTAMQDDPDGKVLYEYTNSEGLLFRNVTVPFGTILIIYESRPDVTIEATAMAFKSGNKIILKGGKEARNTNLYLVNLWKDALTKFGYDHEIVKYLDYTRTEIQEFISSKNEVVDLIIPRGGDALIQFVLQHAVAPVIVSGRGNNFVYVHSKADIQMAVNVIANGKSRISVCNATDKVLIDKNIDDVNGFVHSIMEKLHQMDIQVYGDNSLLGFSDKLMIDAEEGVMYEEFLSPKILLSIAEDVDDAILKINKYSGGHSATIVTMDKEIAQRFMHETDCAAVYHNASTRFTDGGQVGFGGEMAISTQKLHFRGPVGMAQLVTNKWMIYGNGHTR